MKRIFLIAVSMSVAASAFGTSDMAPGFAPTLSGTVQSKDFSRFSRDESTNIVTDTNTTLQWQDDTNGTVVTSTARDWKEAMAHCEALTLGKHTDWRLPTITELSRIADKTKVNPAVDTAAFKNGTPQYYWSSTVTADDERYAQTVNFYNGREYKIFKEYKNFVRCVRNSK